jgi:signal transduction histidine kinase/CheY-like chemotaxis protein
MRADIAPKNPMITSYDDLTQNLDPLTVIPNAAYICDLNGQILKYNNKMVELFGGRPHHHVNHSHFFSGRIFNARQDPLEFSKTSMALALSAGQSGKRQEIAVQLSNGNKISLLACSHLLKGPNDSVIGDINIFEDITERNCAKKALAQYSEDLERSNQDLIQARESAVQAAHAKSDFLANMSHEVRTPLNAIMGMAEILAETPLDGEQKNYLSVLSKASRSLLSIIDEVLNFSKLEGGHFQLENSNFVLKDSIKTVIDLMSSQIRAKKLELRTRIDIDPSEVVHGDPKRLQQILINLLGNSAKFTPSGYVELAVRRRTSLSGSEVEFTVSDSGIGIPANKLNEIFDRFSQADSSVTKTYGGTGMGLAVSKQLVELMGGTIWVESWPDIGSCFHFTVKLPLAKVPSSHNTAKTTPLVGLKILVVDDSPDNTFLVKTFLKNMACDIDTAQNGQQAIEKFEHKDFDLILMDMQMPVMDGYSATRWIRVLEKKKKKKIPIIALSAYVLDEEINKSYEAGCDAHITKPVTKTQLLESIRTYLH